MWDWFTFFLFAFVLLISFPFLHKFDKSRNFKGVWLVLGLIPSYLLLVLRGRSVGVDLEAYELHVIYGDGLDFSDIIFFLGEPLAEVIYWLANMLGGLRAFIFLTASIEYLFLYLACREFHKKGVDISIIFIFFFSAIILRSFNIVLNCMAVVCSLCAYANLLDDTRSSRLKYWLYTILAIGLHNTAFINIPIYFLCSPIIANQNIKHFFARRIVIMLVGVIISYVLLLRYLDIFNTLAEGQYSQYESSQSGLRYGIILGKAPFLLLVLYLYKKLYSYFDAYFFPFFLLLIFDLIFAHIRYIFYSFERFSMYTDIGRIVIIGMICMALYKKTKGKILFFGLVYGIIFSFTYWLYHYDIMGGDGHGVGIMPYHMWP